MPGDDRIVGKKKDLTGQRFGRLVVIEEGPPHYTSGNNRQVCWICKCDCGTIKTITASQLLNGNVKSCGCLRRGVRRKGVSKEKYNIYNDSIKMLPKVYLEKLPGGF